MTARRFQDIWREQVDAGRRVRAEHGVVAALDYIVGEKIETFAATAATRPEFAREMPSFVAEIRRIFSADELRAYLAHRDRVLVDEEADRAEIDDEDDLSTPESRARDRERFARFKDLLLAERLGIA